MVVFVGQNSRFKFRVLCVWFLKKHKKMKEKFNVLPKNNEKKKKKRKKKKKKEAQRNKLFGDNKIPVVIFIIEEKS